MPLPTIATPTYELELPSNKKKVKYRPFLVKEEKILIIAMESEDPKQIARAVKDVITNCILTKGIKVDELSTFDIEYLFLNIRGKSVGEDIEVLITCPDDGMTQVPTLITLDEIKVQISPEHTRDIKLDDNLSLRMKYPSMTEFIKSNFSVDSNSVTVDETFDLISTCVEQVYNEEESWSASDYSKKELLEFLEGLSSKQFKEIEKFFETMPKLSHALTVKNPNTGVESEVVLEGLTAFFG
jgi:T4 bacteriophage base plate protein